MTADGRPSLDPATLRALRNGPLTLLVAFAISRADTCNIKWLSATSGMSPDATKQALQSLNAMLFVEQIARYDWRLTNAGRALLADLAGRLTPQKAESGDRIPLPLPPATPQKAESALPPPPAALAAPLENKPLPDDSAKNGVGSPLTSSSDTYVNNNVSALGAKNDEQLQGYMLEALRAAGVYSNIHIKLTRELLALGGDWPRQVLGWIAYECAGKSNERARASAITQALQQHVRVPNDAYLPPAGLAFQEALAWALRGGAAPDPEPAAPALAAVNWSVVFSDDGAAPDPAAALWRQALLQLQLEMPRTTYDTWVRQTALVQLTPTTYAVVVTNQFAKDWMKNRLLAAIKRTLAGLGARIDALHVALPDELDSLLPSSHDPESPDHGISGED